MSLREIAALLNIDIVPGLFVEIFPIDTQFSTFRFANQDEATVCYVTLDIT